MVQPKEVIQKPAVIHEQVKYEQVEEIQPIINVEKFKTQVVQKTQPLLDKEVKNVNVQQRTLNTEVLPEVNIATGGIPMARDTSTTQYDQASIVVEKAPIMMESENKRIIEEIQPVIYKETIVPTLIKETKPIYQKVVEGATYVQEVLPPRELHSTQFTYPENYTSNVIHPQPHHAQQLPSVNRSIPSTSSSSSSSSASSTKPKKVVEETTTTTTTTVAPTSQNVM